MDITFEENIRAESLKDIARKMMIAARTAPKARGIDNLTIAMVEGETIALLSSKMKEIAIKTGEHFFERDANNILLSPVIVLIGTKISPVHLNHCGMCGNNNCEEKNQNQIQPCAFNTGDLGIAVGSAVSVAANHRADCRVMFSVGRATKQLKIFPEEVKIIYGIPLSASGKSPFFDRK